MSHRFYPKGHKKPEFGKKKPIGKWEITETKYQGKNEDQKIMQISTHWNKMTQKEKLVKLKNANAWGYQNLNSTLKWNELTPHVQGLLLSQENKK